MWGKALTRSLVCAASVVAVLAFGSGPAWASYTAQIVGGALQVTGNAASASFAAAPVRCADRARGRRRRQRHRRRLLRPEPFTAIGGAPAAATTGPHRPGERRFHRRGGHDDGGKNNDTLLGGDGGDFLIGGPGNDFLDGNRGDDLALMGEGNDTFHWDPGDANDTIEGQDGLDTLDFNGANIAERIDISANGGRVRFSRDIANVTMDLDDVEGIVFHALAAWTWTVDDLAGTDVEKVDADLAAQAGGATPRPTVVVNGRQPGQGQGVTVERGRSRSPASRRGPDRRC
jgi:hypothetical protein